MASTPKTGEAHRANGEPLIAHIVRSFYGAALLMTLSRQDRETPQSPCTYRAITLWQPWASLVALRFKQYETRSWSTSYRGKLLIHAAARPVKLGEATILLNNFSEIGMEETCREVLQLLSDPKWYGAIVAIADLTNCQEMWSTSQLPPSAICADGVRANETEILIEDQTELELTVGDWQQGRYAWKMENLEALSQPIYCKGKQGLWIPSQQLIEEVAK